VLNFTEPELLEFLTQFAFDPLKAYGLIVFFIFACSVILPFPEELLVLAAGLIAHAGRISEGAERVVDPITMSVVCFFAIFLSDVLVYFMGKFAGGRIIRTSFFQLRFAGDKYLRINKWFNDYGGWAAGFFRFTPGLRFPGHLCCGFLGMPFWKFALADALACLLFIPPQIILISYFGREILSMITSIQSWFFYALAGGIIIYLGVRYFRKKN
jgi:membrane protein DedA with SNARE-associated domain